MSATLIYVVWFLLVFIEIFRNWCIIHVTKKRPTYWWSQIIRYVISFLFWVIVGALSNGQTLTHYQWWGMIPMMLFTFWFLFDYGLTQFRNFMNNLLKLGNPPIPFYYLNPKGSWLDQFQYNHPASYPWFFWKIFFMAAGILLFHAGIDVIWNVPW